MKKFMSMAMALCMICTMAFSASAAEITTDGSEGQTPVYLSSTDDGTPGGNPSATAMSVTVPTGLPMSMAQNGDVTCASDCKIVNNSYGAVRVKSVTISSAGNWHLTAFGDKSTLAGEKVDSNQLGFAMTIGGGQQVKTTSKASTQQLISSPVTGCFMSGAGDTAHNTAAIRYNAIVTPLSDSVTDTTVANVVFVIEWDMV